VTRIIVRPAGSGRETIYVAALCAVIVALAGAVAAYRARPSDEMVLPAWRIDARDGLNAAEHGLNADLTAAAQDIRAEMSDGAPPSPERLAGDALPPFMKDATSAKRGGHAWRLVRDGETLGYLGATGDPATARSLLLLPGPEGAGAHGHGGETAPVVWVHASATSVDELSDERLIAAGWKQVTSRYDASVTREGR
jgi:hypothetical protein